MDSRALKLAIVVTFQVLVVLGVAAYKYAVVVGGAEVQLRIAPVDPSDLLRGDYLTFRYSDVSNVTLPRAAADLGLTQGGTVYVTLASRGGYWVATDASVRKPTRGTLFIRGKVTSLNGTSINVAYGIEDYFVPEGSGRNRLFGLRSTVPLRQPPQPSQPVGNRTVEVINAGSLAPDGGLSTGMVGHWKLNGLNAGMVPDSAGGDGGRAVDVTMPSFSFPYGVTPFPFLVFNGLTSRIEVSHSPALTIGKGQPFTLAAWVYPVALHPFQTVIVKDRTADKYFANYALRVGNGYGAERKLTFYYYTAGGFQVYASDADIITPNQWSHVAVTYIMGEASSAKLYVNGSLQPGKWVVGTGTGEPMLLGDPLMIGAMRQSMNVQELFDGILGDIRIYNRQLSDDDVRGLVNLAVPAQLKFAQPAARDLVVNVPEFTQVEPLAVVAVDNSGQAVLKQVLVNGVPWP